MFAGEFAAWAGAAECRLAQVNLNFIGIFAASLAFAPGRDLVLAEILPFAQICQIAAGFGRSRIRRKRDDLFGSQRCRHTLYSYLVG